MPAIYEQHLTIAPEANDENGHVNNVVYIQWMQDIATLHSDAQGCTRERYRQLGSSWFIRSHKIDYLYPAFSGDELTIKTWVSSMKRTRSLRRYCFINSKDNRVLARAKTDWVYVCTETGRPRTIDREVAHAFILVSAEEEP